jgi:cbb3-type cytochrome oxidase subunit 1
MRNVSARFVTVGLLYALLAMAFGIWMGVNQDFQYAHLHAHINLVAAVWFVLFALIYKAYPATASTRLAGIHFWLANLGAVLFLPGIYIAQNFDNPLLAIIGALLTIASMAVFLVNFRSNYEAGVSSFPVPGSASRSRSPAE